MRGALRAMTAFALLLAGCAPADPCDRIRDLATSPAGLELTEDEHPGWGETACFQCHQVGRIHTHDCFSAAEIDVAAIADLVDPEDTTSCIPCHGDNGVPEWAPDEADTGGIP